MNGKNIELDIRAISRMIIFQIIGKENKTIKSFTLSGELSSDKIIKFGEAVDIKIAI